jgi:uncharacterized protein YjbI with pentapeptide repeats
VANQEHVDLLQQGVAVWNTWRDKHRDVRPDLSSANLSDTNLSDAYLSDANLSNANLSGANLGGAILTHANLSSADLSHADLSTARVGWTTFGDLDLRTVQGLETLRHHGPSTVGTDTIIRSEGDIPEVFLRGAGLDDTFISYVLSLTRIPIQHYSCFISYSNQDQEFAERLYNDLQGKGVRCWYACKYDN